MNNCIGRIAFMTLITGRGQKEALLAALTEAGGRLINVVYGRCPAKANYLHDMIGLVQCSSRVMVTCLIPCEKTDAALDMLVERFDFGKPDTGTAFTIPVECFSH